MNTLLSRLADLCDGTPNVPLFLIKMTVVLAVAWLLHAASARVNPRWRVLLWRSTAVGLLLLAAPAFRPAYWHWSVLPAANSRMEHNAAIPETTDSAVAGHDIATVPMPALPRSQVPAGTNITAADSFPEKLVAPGGQATGRGESENATTISGSAMSSVWWLGAVWSLGVLHGLSRMLMAARRLRRIGRGAGRIAPNVELHAAQIARSLGVYRRFEIRQTGDLHSPCVLGLIHPTILLSPQHCERKHQDELASILAHELSHLKGNDLCWNALFNALSTLLWFHPLVWRMRAAHADACDAVCDALAANHVGDAHVYVRTLARLTVHAARFEPAIALAMARPSCVRRRIEAVERHIYRAGLPRGIAATVATLFAAALFTFGSVSLSRVSAGPPKTAAPRQSTAHAASETRAVPAGKPQPGFVEGEVVDGDGKPVADATVLLRSTSLHRVTTDKTGQFRVGGLPVGQYRLWAYKDDLIAVPERLVGREATPGGGAEFAPVRLVMKPGKQLKITVTSASQGKPLEGAEVSLDYPDRRKVTTGGDGVAILKALLSENYTITVRAAGHARLDREFDLSKTDSVTTSLSLANGGVLRGAVTDESGRPVAGANVVYRTSGTSYGYQGDAPIADEQGAYRNSHLPLNSPVKVSAGRDGYLTVEKQITLTDGERERRLDFQLERRPRGGSIAGIVTDSDGKPIVGANIANYGDRESMKREATTDKAGRFVLHDLLTNHIVAEIFVRSRGYALVRRKVEPGTEDAPAEVKVVLEPGHAIRGRVVNAAGKPITGAFVTVNHGRPPLGNGDTTRTDDDGQFAFDSLSADSKFRIQATGYSVLDGATLRFDAREPVVVTLEPMGVVKGRVVDAQTGLPLETFRIRLGFSRDRRPEDARGGFLARLGNPGVTFQAKDGAFTIDNLMKGMAFEILADAEGYERTVLPRAVAMEETDANKVEISLKKRVLPEQTALLSGKIVDHKGQGAAGVELRLIVTPEPARGVDDNQFNWVLINSGQLGEKSYVDQYLSTLSDAQGQFEFKGLFADRFLQVVYWGDHVPRGRSLELAKTKPGAAQTVTIALPETAVVRGTFDAATYPKAGRIMLYRQGGGFDDYDRKIAPGKNEFQFENIPPGSYYLSIMGQPERSTEDPQAFTTRSLANLRITVESGKTYEVKFTADDMVKPR